MAGSLGYGHRRKCLPSGNLTLAAESSLGWLSDSRWSTSKARVWSKRLAYEKWLLNACVLSWVKADDNVQEDSEDMVHGQDQKKTFGVHFINLLTQHRALGYLGFATYVQTSKWWEQGCSVGPEYWASGCVKSNKQKHPFQKKKKKRKMLGIQKESTFNLFFPGLVASIILLMLALNTIQEPLPVTWAWPKRCPQGLPWWSSG